MKTLRTLLICCLLIPLLRTETQSQPAYAGAKWEFRGAWVASVKNYDWPLSPGHSPDRQRDSLRVLFDAFAAAGFNAVIFQIRPECDALYASPYEPWSYWLTGSQGTAPAPLYDPLEFAIQEAHARGMELHAWFNPYRAYREDVSYPTHSTHVTKLHPEWIITCPDGYNLMDPGKPQVRDHVSKVIADVVRRYAVDGVHFDDYFYPYSEHSFTRQDSVTWAAYPRGFSWDSVAYWRRDNVNLLVRQVYDSVLALKPWVKFGVSPFGIWKNNVPPGVSGTSAYDVLYCDATAWLSGQYIDYIIPQLYWTFGGGQAYELLEPWWASQRNGRHFYTGNATYRIQQNGWPAAEINAQIRFNQTAGNAQGSVQFRGYNFRTNDGGIIQALRADVFRYPSLVPHMSWKEGTPPNAPQNLQMQYDAGLGRYVLTWQKPATASDGDTAARFAVYRFKTPVPGGPDMQIPSNLLMITGGTSAIPPARVDSASAQYTYAVSALDKNSNESALSNAVAVSGPVSAPLLAGPADGESAYVKFSPLWWQRPPGALQFRVQVDTSGTFLQGLTVHNVLVADTGYVPQGLKALTRYYWRVIAGNQTAESPASAVRSFTTGWPLSPLPVYPVAVRGAVRNPTFRWSSRGGSSFHLEVTDFQTRLVVLDTTVTDTVCQSSRVFAASRNHTWRVAASNAAGSSDWSETASFSTGSTVVGVGEELAPESFSLSQNYPNPFNPETLIRFVLPDRSHVTLRVYNPLGQEVALLQEGVLERGAHAVRFNAGNLSSGVYLYRLQAGTFTASRKMIVLR
jgi:uncharacterized lipoprotein YddW (UPF0748 family)